MSKHLKLIGVEENIKKELDAKKEHKRETYNDVIKRLLEICNKK